MPNTPANLAISPKIQKEASTLNNQTQSEVNNDNKRIIIEVSDEKNVKTQEASHHHPNEFPSTATSKTDCPFERYDNNTKFEDFETPPATPNFKTANTTCSVAALPLQQQATTKYLGSKAKETATTRFLDEHHPQLTRSNSTLSSASSMNYSTQDLFSSISSVDLSGLASQTTNLLESMFGYPTSSTPTTPTTSSVGTSVSGMTSNVLLGNGGSSRYASIGADNHAIIKDAVDKVVLGEGITWLKLRPLKRLMEDEMHRTFLLSYLQRKFGQHLTREGHIEDLCLDRLVWKGVKKLMEAVIYGLEITVTSGSGSGAGMGIASCFQMLELCHTTFWSPSYGAGISNQAPSPMPLISHFFETASPTPPPETEHNSKAARLMTMTTDSLIKNSDDNDNAFETESESGISSTSGITSSAVATDNPSFRSLEQTFQKTIHRLRNENKNRTQSTGDLATSGGFLMPRKSSLSGRYRFYAGSLAPVTDDEKNADVEKTFLFENFIPLSTVEVNANNPSKDYHHNHQQRRMSISGKFCFHEFFKKMYFDFT